MRGFGIICAMLGAAVLSAQSASDELIRLIRNNDLSALKSRLASGADVNTRDSRETTLLMHAAGFGSVDAVKLLLSSGADVKAKNQFGSTALLYGATSTEKARLLVEKGADVNARTKSGRTPLMIAASIAGNSATVKLLLDNGADPKALTERKGHALIDAADANDLQSIRFLLAKGADPKAADAAGNEPLQSAASNCNLASVKLFLEQGANPNSANISAGEVKFGKIQLIGLTPLMFASTFCSPDVVKTLLDAGAKVNAVDIRGMTPLMFAVASEEQNAAVVAMLIKAGADVNAKSTVNESALDWAMKFGSRPVLAALTAAGAKVGTPYAAPMRKAGPTRDPLHAVETATGLLQTGATGFFQQSGCVGCHHQPASLGAVSMARKVGAKTREEEAKAYVKMMEGMSAQFQEPLVERLDVGGASDPWAAMLFALAGENYSPTPVTDLLVHYIAGFQRLDGSWWFGGIARAPSEDGSFARTALALRAMLVYGTPGLKAELAPRIARARDYLLKGSARNGANYETAMQMAGLHWAGGSEDQVKSLGRTLVAAQHGDGGWSQNANLASDAYATGEVLWALQESGVVKPSDPIYQKGVKYLLSTQWEDGSWYVRSRAPKFQPYFQSGFPYDHDQWISSTATSWAVRALAPAVENQTRASR